MRVLRYAFLFRVICLRSTITLLQSGYWKNYIFTLVSTLKPWLSSPITTSRDDKLPQEMINGCKKHRILGNGYRCKLPQEMINC